MRPSFNMSLYIFTTIASSMMGTSCASTAPTETTAPSSKFAPAQVAPAYVPAGDLVDPSNQTTVTFAQLLIFADANAPTIQTSRARAGLAKADLARAEIPLPANPQVSVGAGGRSASGQTGFEFEVALEQQLEVAGEQSLRSQAAQDNQQLAQAAVQEARWSVHMDVHRLVVRVSLAKERLKQAKHFASFSESVRDTVAKQVKAGESSPLVLLVADADLAQTKEAIVEAKQALDELNVRLAAVVGWPHDTPLKVEYELHTVRELPSTEELLGLMATHHPSLRTRELAVVAKQSRLRLEEREAWPEPTVGLSYAREPSLGQGTDASIWLFTFSLPIPLWHTNQQAISLARAQLDVADRQRDTAVQRLRARLRQSVIALDAAAARVAIYEEGVMPKLEENLKLLRRAYELGEIDIHQVSQTRSRLLTATGQFIRARTIYYDAVVTLEGLVGTELWTTEDVP